MLKRCFLSHGLLEVRISVINFNSPALILDNRLGFAPYEIEEARSFDGARIAFIHLKLSSADYTPPRLPSAVLSSKTSAGGIAL